MLKLSGGKICGDNFSVSLPNGEFSELEINGWTGDEMYLYAWAKNAYNIGIEITRRNRQSLKRALELSIIKEKDYVLIGKVTEVERNGLCGVAAYIYGGTSSLYEEIHPIRVGGKAKVLDITIWTESRNYPRLKAKSTDKEAAEKTLAAFFKKMPIVDILKKQEIQEFLNSVCSK